LQQALVGLNSAAGYLRSQVAHRMKLRIMPALHFVHDPSIEEGMRHCHSLRAMCEFFFRQKNGRPRPSNSEAVEAHAFFNEAVMHEV